MKNKIIHIKCLWHEEKTPSLVLSFANNRAYCLSCGKEAMISALADELKLKRGIDIHGK